MPPDEDFDELERSLDPSARLLVRFLREDNERLRKQPRSNHSASRSHTRRHAEGGNSPRCPGRNSHAWCPLSLRRFQPARF